MFEECSECCSASSVQFSLVGDVLIECCSESLNRISGNYLFRFNRDFCGGRSCRSHRAGFMGGIWHCWNIELLENLEWYSNIEAAVQQLLR